MNTHAYTTTVRDLIPASILRGRLTEQSAYDLAALNRREFGWEQFLSVTVRVPEKTRLERIKRDAERSVNNGWPAPDLTDLMRRCIRFGLRGSSFGSGNRARRRIEALNMAARRKMRNPKGWDKVDTFCPGCIPAAPKGENHLTCA